jgi:hypothetical protein
MQNDETRCEKRFGGERCPDSDDEQHACWRMSAGHRTHMCTCGALDLPATGSIDPFRAAVTGALA